MKMLNKKQKLQQRKRRLRKEKKSKGKPPLVLDVFEDEGFCIMCWTSPEK